MSISPSPLGIRWTVGNVSDRGFEALRLSLWGAHRLFGDRAAYVVCHNGLSFAEARTRVGPVPDGVAWFDAENALPHWLHGWLGEGMAEGVAWKFAPLRLFPDRFELSLDNDCVLWGMPEVIRAWLNPEAPGRCILAEDVRPAFGQFAERCGPEPRNLGIRGLPPGFDLEQALKATLEETSAALGRRVVLTSELDEQGLQVAALAARAEVLAVRQEEVTICSPFWPHQSGLGSCGAHFVGLNARHIPWDYYDRPADEWMRAHWARHLPALQDLTSAPRGPVTS